MDTIGETFAALLGSSSEPCLLVDANLRVTTANHAAHGLLGLDGRSHDRPDVKAVLVGDVPPRRASRSDGGPHDRDSDAARLDRTLAAGWRTGSPVATTIVLPRRGERWQVQAWRVQTGAQTAPLLMVRLRPHDRVVERFAVLDAKIAELSEEVRRRRSAQRRLQRTSTELETIFGRAPVGMAVAEVGPAGAVHLRRANPSLCALTGRDELSLARLSLAELVEPRHAERAAMAMARLVAENGTVSFETALRHASGTPVWATVNASLMAEEDTCSPSAGTDGAQHRAVLQFVDLSERRHHEAQLQYLADHDALTGLFNRRRFEQELRAATANVRRYGTPTSVLLIDLDNFKAVNDAFGHAVGDLVLGRTARTIDSRLRETDVVGRLGGDEFAVLLPHTGRHDALQLAEDLRAAIRSSAGDTGQRPLWVTATIGVAELPADIGATSTGAEVLGQADAAMYEAKEAGRDRVAVVDPAEPPDTRRDPGLTWVQRIRDALHDDRFVLHAQPILDLRTGAVNRYELLLRMDDGDGGLVPPSAFLPIAEQFGLIHAIDRWVVEHAVSLLARWQADGHSNRDLSLEVNLSGASITDERVVDAIEERILAAGIDAGRLVFEITETAAIRNIDLARRFAERLGSLGCTFALDDFGAGFGALQYLKHLPADCVKIDGEFIRRLPEDTADQVTVAAIVQLAQGLGKSTVAEFVDRPETLALVAAHGVDFAQGYHIGRPCPVDEINGSAVTLVQ